MPRNLETFINEQTIKDLIISHLHNIGVFRDYEEVRDLELSEVSEGLRKLTLRFERNIQVIHHP
jgi:hypothetical protein